MCLIKEILQLIIFHLFSSLDKLIRLAAMTVTTSFLLLLRLIIFYVINLKFLELFQIETNSCFDNFERFFINIANKNLHLKTLLLPDRENSQREIDLERIFKVTLQFAQCDGLFSSSIFTIYI